MRTPIRTTLALAVLASLSVLAASGPAAAQTGPVRNAAERAADRHQIADGKVEVRDDRADLARLEALVGDWRAASAAGDEARAARLLRGIEVEIARDLRENAAQVADDEREVRQSRREVRGDRREVRHDRTQVAAASAAGDRRDEARARHGLRDDRRDRRDDRRDLRDDRRDRDEARQLRERKQAVAAELTSVSPGDRARIDDLLDDYLALSRRELAASGEELREDQRELREDRRETREDRRQRR